MDFSPGLQQGLLQRRYKRFFADIEVGGKTLTAHVPNTGSLKGCLYPQARCLFSTTDDPNRKLPCTLQMVEADGTWVGVNTHLANDLVWEAWHQRQISHWSDYSAGQREVKISKSSRIDFVLWKPNKEFPPERKISAEDFSKRRFRFVEIKNVTMAVQGLALFPDAVTERGQKHLRELMTLVDQGHDAEIVFVVQRQDCRAFAPADEIDAEYGQLLRKALAHGVRISVFGCRLSAQGIRLNGDPLPLEI